MLQKIKQRISGMGLTCFQKIQLTLIQLKDPTILSPLSTSVSVFQKVEDAREGLIKLLEFVANWDELASSFKHSCKYVALVAQDATIVD